MLCFKAKASYGEKCAPFGNLEVYFIIHLNRRWTYFLAHGSKTSLECDSLGLAAPGLPHVTLETICNDVDSKCLREMYKNVQVRFETGTFLNITSPTSPPETQTHAHTPY